jgi:endogenous inhibitor of DNA gyrase (YacG/DUF329 family)
MRCPVCDKVFDREQSTAAPICGERCRSIDLSRWLGEVYSLPVEGGEGNADESATIRSAREASNTDD